MARYLRKYELVFGEPYSVARNSIETPYVLSPESKLQAFEDYIRKAYQGKGGYKLTEHHIEFSIEKTNNGSSANSSNIKIANPSNDIVRYLGRLTNKKVVVMLKAGYEGEDLKTLFIGNLEKFTDTFESETRWLELFLKDGGTNYTDTFTTRVYKKGTKLNDIVDDLVGDLKLPKSGSYVVKSDIEIERNWYFSGSVWEQLHKLATYYNYKFSVQDSTVFWMPIGVGKKKEVALINPDSGLIGSVSPIDSNNGVSQSDESGAVGVKFKTLLDGSLLPETTVIVETPSEDEDHLLALQSKFRQKEIPEHYAILTPPKDKKAYKINKVVHTGSMEGETWFSEVEAEEVEVLI